MTTQEDYTEEEWQLIIRTPVAIISAVIGVSPNGPVGLMQEIGAAVKTFQNAAENRASNPLIAAVLVALKTPFERYLGRGSQPDAPADVEADVIELGRNPQVAIDMCRRLITLLEEKAPAAEAEEFRRWLLVLAQRVAAAAKEGGFLGIGGEHINEDERALLQDFATALQVPATTDSQ